MYIQMFAVYLSPRLWIFLLFLQLKLKDKKRKFVEKTRLPNTTTKSTQAQTDTTPQLLCQAVTGTETDPRVAGSTLPSPLSQVKVSTISLFSLSASLLR